MTPLTALLIDWVITSLWPIIAASAMAQDNAILFTWAGLLLGLILLAPWLLRQDRLRRIFSPKLRMNLFLMGFLSGITTIVYIAALNYTSPANAAIMAQVEILYSTVLTAIFLGERPTIRQSAASLLILSGTGIILARDFSGPRWKGDLMILATPWLFQVSHIFAKRLPEDLDAVTITGGRVIYGLIAIFPAFAVALAVGARWSWSGASMGALGAQALCLSSLNFVLWYKAIRGMDLSKATAIMLSYPILTMVFSWLLGRDTIGMMQLAGLALSLAGAYWMSLLVLNAAGKPSKI
jgi:drug/metabolite transporter (DMT)-like permease